jgi:uncharacterized protein
MTQASTDIRTYPQGVPSWIELGSDDLDGAKAFYGSLLGWTFETVTPPGAPTYAVAHLDGQDAAGLAQTDRPLGWSTYLAVDDADAMADEVTRRGGRVESPPTDAGEGGRAATCFDPQGVEFRLWQARRRPGVQALNRPGAWNFSDLHTDEPTSVDFYAALFGWEVDDQGTTQWLRRPGYGDHLAATVDPDIHARQASAPPGFADVIGGVAPNDPGLVAHWHVTFTVADRDDTVAVAERLGATVLETTEDQWTRRALLRDPQGEAFTASQFTPPDDF